MSDEDDEFDHWMEDWDEDGIGGVEDSGADDDQPAEEAELYDDPGPEADDPPRSTSRELPAAPCRLRVGQGDCMASLAAHYGLPAERILVHPENAHLRERDSRVLLPGDEVYIPEREPSTLTIETEHRHRFELRRPRSRLRIQLLREGEPRSGREYVLEIMGRDEPITGTTDSDGFLEAEIPADARRGRLRVMPGNGEPDEECIPLRLGELDPPEVVSGIQARLNNLGFFCGAVDNQLGPRTRAAIAHFQQRHNLTVTGDLDETTKLRLKEMHGS